MEDIKQVLYNKSIEDEEENDILLKEKTILSEYEEEGNINNVSSDPFHE
jgi:hypothetical protein